MRLAEAFQHLDLLFGERGAHGGDDVFEAELVGGDDVHVALDDHGSLQLPGGLPGPVSTVEGAALVEYRGLGRVDVLGPRVGHGPAAEPDNPATGVTDWEHQTAAENIADLTGLVTGSEACIGAFISAEAVLGEVLEEGAGGGRAVA